MRSLVFVVAALTAGTISAGAQISTHLCALLPDADVSAVVGTPVKLVAGAVETTNVGGGTLRSQQCSYNPPGGIGSGPTTVRVTISEASSPAVAAQMFKVESQTLRPMVAGNAEPVAGLGDEAVAFPKPGSVYMRKKGTIVDISVGLRDLDTVKAIALGKQLAQKAAARVQ